MTEPIRIEFEVACSPEHAFDTWANRTSMWWPPSHSMTSDPGLVVTFESRPGGRIYERTPDGTEHDWGEVLAWEPPHRLAYLWHLGTDRGRATEVEISFTGHAAATTVSIVHRGWERLGPDGPAWQRRNRQGWAGLLPHYREAVGSQPRTARFSPNPRLRAERRASAQTLGCGAPTGRVADPGSEGAALSTGP